MHICCCLCISIIHLPAIRSLKILCLVKKYQACLYLEEEEEEARQAAQPDEFEGCADDIISVIVTSIRVSSYILDSLYFSFIGVGFVEVV